MIDLFIQADNNKKPLSVACKKKVTKLAKKQRKLAKKFKKWVKNNAQISINLSAFVALELINGVPYKNAHQVAQERAEKEHREKEVCLREVLKEYYDKRIMFDRSFKYGEDFKYGALNAGGCGLTTFHPYCAVLNNEFHATLSLCACFPGDTLVIYFTEEFNSKAACEQATPFSHHHYLATHSWLDKIINTPNCTDWPGLLLSVDPNRYIEVIFTSSVTLENIVSLRVSEKYYDDMGVLQDRFFKDPALTIIEEANLSDFTKLLSAQKAQIINLEVVS